MIDNFKLPTAFDDDHMSFFMTGQLLPMENGYPKP